MCLTVYVLAIIHSVYSEELMEQLSAGLESSIYIDGFRFAEHTSLNCQLLQKEQGSFDHFAQCPHPPHGLFKSAPP